ncbi:hypothetical protein TNCV_2144581 [Trichonephila clavipes]|nr:hypothetical protein TNCV_2144581 [Trichonephila clavipes]
MGSIEMLTQSIRLQNAEFKKYIREVEFLDHSPTAASPASQQKRPLAFFKRQPASPQKDVPSKSRRSRSESSHAHPPPSPYIEDSSSMEEGETSKK